MIFTTQRQPSKDLLLDNVSELDIFLLFCENFKGIGRRFKSPILVDGRPNDGSEAANIISHNGSLKLYDWRVGESYDAFSFAMLMTGMNFRECIRYLCERFGIIGSLNTDEIKQSLRSRNISIPEIKDLHIDVKYKSWSLEAIQYWVSYGWKPYMLDIAKIRPIEKFWVTDNDSYRREYNHHQIGPISFAYDFCKVDGVFRRKIYNPLAPTKDLKWKNNTNKQIIQALNTIDYHIDTLYIVSSMKDCGPFWTILGKPCAIAPNSESSLFTPNQIRMMRQVSDRQVIWFDGDSTGRSNTIKQANLYGFDYVLQPRNMPKDQSDTFKECGGSIINKIINET